MAPKIVALISTYQEEEIIASCIKSAFPLDSVIIFDGTTGMFDRRTEHKNRFIVGGEFEDAFRAKAGIPYDEFYVVPGSDFTYVSGSWNSDAHKRTEMLQFAQRELDWENGWALWLDGDEVLLWGEYLHDHCQRADNETATGGTTLRIVEYDGSVAECFGKLIKLDTVKRYVMSSYEIELTNGMTVALPNVPICYAGGIPYGEVKTVDDPLLAKNRPPVQGEPHLLHRHGLRNPERQVARMHDAEEGSFSELLKSAGLQDVEIRRQKGNGNG